MQKIWLLYYVQHRGNLDHQIFNGNLHAEKKNKTNGDQQCKKIICVVDQQYESWTRESSGAQDTHVKDDGR